MSVTTRSQKRSIAQQNQPAQNEEAQQASTKQASLQDTQQATTTQDGHVDINWFFFEQRSPSMKDTKDTFTSLPLQFFKEIKCGYSREIFATQLRDEFLFEAKEPTVKFWKPNNPLLISDAEKPGWMESVEESFRDLFKAITPLQRFAQHLDDINNETIIHLLVTAEGSYIGADDKEYHETEDIATELPEIQRYHKIISTPGKSPSVGSKSKDYAVVQTHEFEAIHDGRRPPVHTFTTVAPPVQIFHPIFDKFLKLVNDPSVRPTQIAIKKTSKLMNLLSVIGLKEIQRNFDIRQALTEILEVEVVEEPNLDKSVADGVHVFVVNTMRLPIFIMELKRELGDGGSDPSTQSGITMRRSWIQPNRASIRDKCCCPTLILAGGGPWMGVLGGVFTDKIIVQRLTDLMWVGYSSTEEDNRVYRFARVLNALRLCIFDLRNYYDEIAGRQDLSLVSDKIHPRFYPYPTSFTDDNNQVINFQYLNALEHDPACVTYKAKVSEDDIIVVKFVSRYSPEVHRLLSTEGHAPKLRYFGQLPDASERLAQSLAQDAPPGLSLGPMHIVIMDYIADSGQTPPDAREQLKEVLIKLHKEGYVFGDLRRPNILFDHENKVKLIDFDWAGRYDMAKDDTSLPEGTKKILNDAKRKSEPFVGGYVHYPLNLTPNLWAKGMADLEPIRPVHDWDMLRKLFP